MIDQQSHSGRKEVIWQREACCQNVSHSFKVLVCVSATILCFDRVHSLAQQTQLSFCPPSPFEAVKNPFNLVVSNCDTDKMSTRDWKGGKKCAICHFPLRTGSSRAMETHDRIGKMENHYVKEAGYTKSLPRALSLHNLFQYLKNKPKRHTVGWNDSKILSTFLPPNKCTDGLHPDKPIVSWKYC